MKYIFTTALIMLFSSIMSGQIISDEIQIVNGDKVDNSHIFIHSESCIFNTVDMSKCNWIFYLYTNDEEYVVMSKSDIASNTYLLNLSDLSDKLEWKQAKRFISDRSTLYKGAIAACKGNNETDRIELTFELAPRKPAITSLEYEYLYNWEYDDMDSGILNISIESEFSNKIHISVSDSFFLEIPEHIIFIRGIPYIETTNGKCTWIDDLAQWGQIYSFVAYNSYGRSDREIIFNSDYITDPDVLSRLNELNEMTTHVTTCTNETAQMLLIDGKTIRLLHDETDLKTLSIYTTTGNIVYTTNNLPCDISHLSSGVYIAICETQSNKILTSKFILK